MTTDNWIALAAVMLTLFGLVVAAAYLIVKLMIKSSSDDLEIERLKDKIERLREHVREMN